MTSYEERVALVEFLYRKPGVTLPEIPTFPEFPEILECLIRDAFNDRQRSMVQLGEQVADLETRNRELKEYAHMVAHDLKEPLTILIMTADLIRDVHDLTSEEMMECCLQIKSTAYEMRSIIKNLLLFAEVSKSEAPRGAVPMAEVVANVQARLSYMIKEQQAQVILPPVWPNALGCGPWIEEVWAFTPGNPVGRPSNLGHGLGLPIVFNIVEKLGGQVGVESEVGKGSLSFFTLPAGAS